MCTVETFYSVLGVARDADTATIVRAYRDKVKSYHPDVSDRSDATETFKRLTTAKEVLADETERSEYDRLGHESYVRRHGDCSGWSVESDSGGGRTGATSSTAGPAASPASKAARAYADGGGSTADATPREEPTRAASSGTATAYYQPGQRMNPGVAGGGANGVLSRFGGIGPWIVLDGILLVSALATAWVILSWGSLSLLSIVLAAVLCVAAFAVTALHLSSKAYA